MSKVLIIGAGGVSNVVVRKCAQNSEVYSEILLASRNIPKIDNMIVDLKKSYISQCYEPILAKNPPENQCQTELFQMLERRYHLNYNQQNIDQASNDLFFRDVDSRLRKMVRTDPEVRSAVRSGAFRNADEMLSYYKEKYAFDTRSQN